MSDIRDIKNEKRDSAAPEKRKRKSVGALILRLLFPMLAVLMIAAYVVYTAVLGHTVTLENLIEHTPESVLPAAIALIVFYILKSLSYFFPVTVLYALGGYVLGPWLGCAVNMLGNAAACALQYFMGRTSGKHAARRLTEKHPRLGKLLEAQERSPIYSVFTVRLFSVVSGDIISYYFGASGADFGHFMLGSLLGVLPGVISVTFLGTSVSDPTSPMFIWTAALSVGIFAVTFAGRRICQGLKNRKKRTRENEKG